MIQDYLPNQTYRQQKREKKNIINVSIAAEENTIEASSSNRLRSF